MAISVAEAEALILRYAGSLDKQDIPLGDAAGRILRQDIIAERAQPPYDRVMMDGIAFRAEASFPLLGLGMQRAGKPRKSLPEGDRCFEVTTGAVLPLGADCVLPIEALRHEGKKFSLIDAQTPRRPGQFIHKAGADTPKGQRLLSAGDVLSGPALAIAAANGYHHLEVSALPKIALVATGDELVDVEGPVETWQIRRSNEFALLGMLQKRGISSVQRVAAPDDLLVMVKMLEQLLAEQDILVLSGGVSMGAFDFVPKALGKLGVERVFHKVMQRPGGPLWFGIGPEGQRVFGLPGNPVSAMVCMARYVLPQIEASLGKVNHGSTFLRLLQPLQGLADRVRFVPVMHDGHGGAALCALPDASATSGDFMTLGRSDGILMLPAGGERHQPGEKMAFYAW